MERVTREALVCKKIGRKIVLTTLSISPTPFRFSMLDRMCSFNEGSARNFQSNSGIGETNSESNGFSDSLFPSILLQYFLLMLYTL